MNLHEEFRNVDINKFGWISGEQLQQCFSNLGVELEEDEFKQLLFEIDSDRNNKIDVDEFMEFMQKNIKGLETNQNSK